jgi:hypothetical protein
MSSFICLPDDALLSVGAFLSCRDVLSVRLAGKGSIAFAFALLLKRRYKKHLETKCTLDALNEEMMNYMYVYMGTGDIMNLVLTGYQVGLPLRIDVLDMRRFDYFEDMYEADRDQAYEDYDDEGEEWDALMLQEV